MEENKKPYNLHERLLLFGKRMLEICKILPPFPECNRIRTQLGASGTSIGANYEEADGSITKKDFINKLVISRKEAKETRYIQSMRMLTDSLTFFEHAPHPERLLDREENEAYCMAIPEKEYAIYFPGEGDINLQVPGTSMKYKIYWLNIAEHTWNAPVIKEEKGLLRLKTPGKNASAVWVSAQIKY